MTQADGGFMGSGFVCSTPPNKKRENLCSRQRATSAKLTNRHSRSERSVLSHLECITCRDDYRSMCPQRRSQGRMVGCKKSSE